MDLSETRRIPMWLAHPALPVGVGGLLLVCLLGLEAATRVGAPDEPAPAPPAAAPANPVVVAGPTSDSPLVRALQESRAMQRRGDYLGAVRVLRALPADVRKVHGADLAGEESRCLQNAGLRVIAGTSKQPRREAIAALTSFLTLPEVQEHPVRDQVADALADLQLGK